MAKVTVAEMIAYLERLDGDTEVRLSIGDYYSRYGETAHFSDFSMDGCIWNHPVNGNQITLVARLDDQQPMTSDDVVRHPKITFRKG